MSFRSERERGAGHVLHVELTFGGKNDFVIVGLQTMLGHTVENRLFESKGDGGRAGDSRTACKTGNRMFPSSWGGALPNSYARPSTFNSWGNSSILRPTQKRSPTGVNRWLPVVVTA